MNKPVTVFLDEAQWIEFRPTLWAPTTGDERLAGLVAYMTGDGSIALRSAKYVKKRCGTTSVYKPTMTGAFYSNVRADIEAIQLDCAQLGMATGCKIGVKKTLPEHRANGFQFQLCASDCLEMANAGTPVGKKTTQEFSVPDWIVEGSAGVKRAYLAALFGAEGSMPAKDASSRSRALRPITLSMCKIAPASGEAYFAQLRAMLSEFGVASTVSKSERVAFSKPYVTYRLRISGIANLIAFCERVSYLYCADKALAAWKWLQYLKAYRAESQRRVKTLTDMIGAGITYEEAGGAIGITRGAAHRLMTDIRAGKTTTAGHGFPHYDEWIAKRWIPELGLMRLMVSQVIARPKPQQVWNMLVSSPDHSYLLASGANNFNSFETMSGRVYYSFDRSIHVRPLAFNPSLPIWVGQDFNIDPMSSVILQPQENGEVWAVDEIVLRGSNTEEVCDELERRYWRAFESIVLFPDPAGQYKQHARGESDLDIFRERGLKKQRFHRKHPPIADRVNAVNRMLKSADGRIRLFVDPKCKHLIASLEQTIYKKGSREIDKDADVEHSADALGYCIQYQFPSRKVDIVGVSI